ncbi:hypothetical protein SDC9_58510 [bioreactor metagenome]|uniref:Uncharacterized protein n=1 Tax=bioreactor metagenome TaxID=1076179 RepID=A0A644X8K0_9ZZZZ
MPKDSTTADHPQLSSATASPEKPSNAYSSTKPFLPPVGTAPGRFTSGRPVDRSCTKTSPCDENRGQSECVIKNKVQSDEKGLPCGQLTLAPDAGESARTDQSSQPEVADQHGVLSQVDDASDPIDETDHSGSTTVDHEDAVLDSVAV